MAAILANPLAMDDPMKAYGLATDSANQLANQIAMSDKDAAQIQQAYQRLAAVPRTDIGQPPSVYQPVSAQTMPEGLLKGASAALGSGLQLRAYNQRNQQAQAYQQQQLQYQQQALDLARNNAAIQQARQMGAIQHLPVAQQPLALAEPSTAIQGAIQNQQALALEQGKPVAQMQGRLGALDLGNRAVPTILNPDGTVNAAAQTQQQYLLDKPSVTPLDVRAQELKNANDAIAARYAAPKAQGELQKMTLENQRQTIENQYIAAEKEANIAADRAKLNNDLADAKTKHEAWQMASQMVKAGDAESSDPGVQMRLAAWMKAAGVSGWKPVVGEPPKVHSGKNGSFMTYRQDGVDWIAPIDKNGVPGQPKRLIPTPAAIPVAPRPALAPAPKKPVDLGGPTQPFSLRAVPSPYGVQFVGQ